LFKPLDDLTLDEVKKNIFPIQGEVVTGFVVPERLIEDYVFSRNIAKYGLKYRDLVDIWRMNGFPGDDHGPQAEFFFHMYAMPKDEKVVRIKEILRKWGIRTR
jgi:hypothetical protein